VPVNVETFFILLNRVLLWQLYIQKKKKKEIEVNKIPAGEYFGERALIGNTKRTANVRAVGPLKVAAIDRAAFERLFGSCSKIMKRKIEKYKTSVE